MQEVGKKFGFFSEKMCLFFKEKRNSGQADYRLDELGVWMSAREKALAVVYSTPSGGELVVTSVAANPLRGTSWPDEKPVGEVARYLRPAEEADIVKAYPWMADSLSAAEGDVFGADLRRKLAERSDSAGQKISWGIGPEAGSKKP